MNTNITPLRLLLPESIWLEPEQIEQARIFSHQASGETPHETLHETPHEISQWQAYLNALALLGLEQWLQQRLPEQPIEPITSEIATAGILQVGEFRLCLLATEHILNELISIPQATIDQPALRSHFYVVMEALEEQEEVIIRGFLRHDQLIDYCNSTNASAAQGHYSVPLSCFDPEPNHLLFHCRFLEPAAAPLSMASSETIAPALLMDKIRQPLQETKTRLSQWLQGTFDEAWQAIDTLINPDFALALSTRSSELNIKRGKLINLGMQLGSQAVALLMIVTPEPENKLAVLVQLHPTGGERVLPPQIKLSQRSRQGRSLQEVESRSGDNYIQLRSFRGEPGKLFSIEVSLGETRVKEDFEL